MSDGQGAQHVEEQVERQERPAGFSPGVQEPQSPVDAISWQSLDEGQALDLGESIEDVEELVEDELTTATGEDTVASQKSDEGSESPRRAVAKPTPPPIPVLTAELLTAAANEAARSETQPMMPALKSGSMNADNDEDSELVDLMNEIVSSEQKKKRSSGRGRATKVVRPVRPWYEDIFDGSWLKTLPEGFHAHTVRETDFLVDTLGLDKGARILDAGCGFGRHAVQLAERGYDMVGLDLSLELLEKALAEAQRRDLSIKFIHGDVRDLNFDKVFDGAYCLHTTFGYFDDRTNYEVLEGMARSLKLGGRMVIEVLNRDWVLERVPRRIWWEGGEYLFLEDVEFDYTNSRLSVERTVVDEADDPWKQKISLRCYSLHEMHTLMKLCGCEIVESSGDYVTRGAFLGTSSRYVIVTAERVA